MGRKSARARSASPPLPAAPARTPSPESPLRIPAVVESPMPKPQFGKYYKVTAKGEGATLGGHKLSQGASTPQHEGIGKTWVSISGNSEVADQYRGMVKTLVEYNGMRTFNYPGFSVEKTEIDRLIRERFIIREEEPDE